MILYVCRTCGKWQDVSLAQTLQKVLLDSMFTNASSEHKDALMEANVFDCPDGHGAMENVKPDERIAVLRPGDMIVSRLSKEE